MIAFSFSISIYFLSETAKKLQIEKQTGARWASNALDVAGSEVRLRLNDSW